MNVLSFYKTSDELNHTENKIENFWKFIYQSEEKGEILVDGVLYTLSEGDVCIVPPNTTYAKRGTDALNDFNILIKDITPIGSLQFKIIKDDQNYSLKKLFELGYVFYTENKGIDSDHLLSILNSIGETIYSILAGLYSASLSNINQQSLEGFLDKMQANVSNYSFNISDEIEKYGYNVVYFRRIFKKRLNTTPTAYMNKLRIEQAIRILDQYGYSKSVREIAYNCGFTDVNYFNRVFKKITHTSPTQYLINYKK